MSQNIQSQQDQRALAHLQTACGQSGSGRLRYAAAMHFNRKGMLSDAMLEVYRICAANDAEDPSWLLQQRGMSVPFPDWEGINPKLRIRLLIEEIDQYLSGLPGPGVAEVRHGITRSAPDMDEPVLTPENGLVSTYLDTALGALAKTHPALAARIGDAAPLLNWITYDGYPAEEIGADFRTGHAYASIIGEDSAVAADDFDLGLFLIAPHVLYRDHRHAAPELYAPLTGPHGWRFGTDQPLIIKPAHDPVWNHPNAPHMTKVGALPFLCIFGWTRDVRELAQVIPATDWAELEALRLTP